MSKNKSLSMKSFPLNKSSKNMSATLSNSDINHKKLIKINGFGKKVYVPYDEFLSLRKKDRGKMKALKDSLIHRIKTKKEIYIRQNAYDMESLKKICLERENEFRESIYNLQKEIRKERKVYASDIYEFYKDINSMIKKIYDSANNEIKERIKYIDSQININIANCDYKQNKALEKKIKENEEPFKYMHYCIFQMKKSMKDFDILNKKVYEFQETNYNYKKKLLKENIKTEYLIQLMKKIKIKNNNLNNLLTDFNNNLNTKTISNESHNPKPLYMSIFNSKNNKKIYTNLNSFSTQKILKNNTSPKKDLLLTIDVATNQIRRRPISSGQRLTTVEFHDNSTRRTNYSNSNTFQSNFRINNSKGKPINYKTNSHKNIFNSKFKMIKNSLNKKMLKTNPNSYLFSSTLEENDENKKYTKYTKSELNSLNLIKKEIKNLKNRQNELLYKINYKMPNNELYQSVVNIIEDLRNDKTNLIVDGINNQLMKSYMKAIPIQDKGFRRKFLNILFNDKNVLESIIKATNHYNYNFFNKNIVGAEKKNKSSKI